jgi:hypothetical protein
MFDFHVGNLSGVFDNFFQNVSEVHNYNTRSSTKNFLYISKIRTDYGRFNLRYCGSLIWNSIDTKLKSLSKYNFKTLFKISLLQAHND